MRRAVALLATLLPALAAAGVRPAFGGTVRVAVPSAPAAGGEGTGPVDLLLQRALAAPLLELDGGGRLHPGALAEVPLAEDGGRAFRLRLRPGLADAEGRPFGAAELAAQLTRLLRASPPSPHGWLALPIAGSEAVLAGQASSLAGVQVLSPTELLVLLSHPLPRFPLALATSPLSVPGAGPFVAGPSSAPGAPLRLEANPRHHAGRPFADAVELRPVDPRSAARLLAQGGVDLVLRPEAAGGRPGPALPALTATVAAVNVERLGAGAEPLRHALASLDRGELARRFVRGPAEPLATLVPASILGGGPAPGATERSHAPSAPVARRAASAPGRISLLADSSAPDQRALAERIQVKLFDRGVAATLELVDGPRLRSRLAAGAYDVALVPVPVLAPDPALAAAQVAWTARGPAAARRALEALAGASPEAGAEPLDALARELGLVPLVATGWRASLGPALEGLVARPDGALDLAELWRVGGPHPTTPSSPPAGAWGGRARP
jgi:peptide/nickel transport system substrate-binding protein